MLNYILSYYKILTKMIGRLILSDRNIYKIKSGIKQVSARKCCILSETELDTLVKTSKEFNSRDEYIKFNPQTNTIIEGFGHIGTDSVDLNIYYHLFTNGWKSNSKYSKLWDEYLNTNQNPYDLATKNGINRLNYHSQVITIDPEGSIDLDDGFSLNFNNEYWNLDIHIADPVSWFELNSSNPLFIQIFEELNNRLQSCYIDFLELNKNSIQETTHLLPPNIVKLVSLLENKLDSPIQAKRAISFCFKISKKTNTIESFNLIHTNLSNIKNYTYTQYDEYINSILNTELKNEFIKLFNVLKNIIGLSNNIYEDIKINDNISHKMIEIFMILTNWYGGNYLITNLNKFNTIIRIQDKKDFGENFDIEIVPEYARPYLSASANYIQNNNSTNQTHYSLNISNYSHISSPMRRFIDMLNHFGFYGLDWTNLNITNSIQLNLDKINTKIKIQKKISNGWKLVKFLKSNPESNIFKACLFDWVNLTNSNKKTGLLVLYQKEFNLISMVNVELPYIDLTLNLKKYMEWNIELYYNSNNFKSTKFPFSIKIV